MANFSSKITVDELLCRLCSNQSECPYNQRGVGEACEIYQKVEEVIDG